MSVKLFLIPLFKFLVIFTNILFSFSFRNYLDPLIKNYDALHHLYKNPFHLYQNPIKKMRSGDFMFKKIKVIHDRRIKMLCGEWRRMTAQSRKIKQKRVKMIRIYIRWKVQGQGHNFKLAYLWVCASGFSTKLDAYCSKPWRSPKLQIKIWTLIKLKNTMCRI